MESGALSQFSKATPPELCGAPHLCSNPFKVEEGKTRLQGHPQLHETQGLRKTALL